MTAAFRRAIASFSLLMLATGCIHQPGMLSASKQKPIDRAVVEYPAGFELTPIVDQLNNPTAIAFDPVTDSILIAESGADGSEPHVFGYHLKDGSYFDVYPFKRNVSFFPTGFVMYGPVGGMVVWQGKIIVSHRDRAGKGVITSLGYDGSHSTIIADLPAQGDYGITDLAISPSNGRLHFGVGTATNSGVVGVDNWNAGWLKRYPEVHDIPYTASLDQKIFSLGRRFDTPDPRAGLFGYAEIAVTAIFQPFGVSNRTQIAGSSDKPNGAIYSVNPNGGDSKIEAFGLHNPRGLGFNEFSRSYVTNDGMEMRGTRPVKDDPDSLLRIAAGTYYGWPDLTTNLKPVSDPAYQPPEAMMIRSGYADNSAVVDLVRSGLHPASERDRDRETYLTSVFPSQSGAAKFDFVPGSGPFKDFRGKIVITLSGDHAPFATGGLKLSGPVGYKVVLVDPDTKQTKDFIVNTANIPASMQHWGTIALERPCDAKFGPDGALYILDAGIVDYKTAIPRYHPGTGRLFRMHAIQPPTTQKQ